MHATGTFDVKVTPVEPSEIAKAADTGRMTIDKTWTGGLTGSSKGEMLTGITKENASMAYVAMERFTGTVDGHEGTLLFSHTAFMLDGKPKPEDLNITAFPAQERAVSRASQARSALRLKAACTGTIWRTRCRESNKPHSRI